MRAVNPEIPTYNEFAMEELVARSTVQRRFVMLLLAGFAAAAMLLAGLGIYGTVSQAVAQRTAEIGVRMALGASPAEVLRMVLGEGARLMAAGGAAGLAAAAALAWLMRAMLFEIAPLGSSGVRRGGAGTLRVCVRGLLCAGSPCLAGGSDGGAAGGCRVRRIDLRAGAGLSCEGTFPQKAR